MDVTKICITFVPDSETNYMVDVAQLVRVTDCGSEGRGFESHLPPLKARCEVIPRIFFCSAVVYKQASTPVKQKNRSCASLAFNSVIWEIAGLPQSCISAPHKCDCETPSVMTRKRDIQIPSSTLESKMRGYAPHLFFVQR